MSRSIVGLGENGLIPFTNPCSEIPLGVQPRAAFAFARGSVISASEFRVAAISLAAGFPPTGEVVNLCESRYAFLVAFYAALLRATTTLLPPSRSAVVITEMLAAHPGCVVVNDLLVERNSSSLSFALDHSSVDFIAVIGHTSGSTGKPVAHPKSWRSFHATTKLNAAVIRAELGESAHKQQPWLVATAPPQHMYGLETSILLPLLAGFGIHCGKPLLPADVAVALAQVPMPRILVSTPLHLRAMVDSAVDFPEISIVLSATAPLSQELARRIETRLGATVIEMFGSTETCVVATRKTAHEVAWRAYPGVQLAPVDEGTIVRAPWLLREQLLHDVVEIRSDRSFTIVGRRGDMVEIAGRRASLPDLTRRLAALPGVKDAVVFQPPPSEGGKPNRCAALVVAPGLTAREISRRFRAEVDAIFVPRPLVVVPELPRNELGKLPLERLLALLTEVRQPVTAASRPRREK